MLYFVPYFVLTVKSFLPLFGNVVVSFPLPIYHGISFSSRDGQLVHTFLHHPDISDAEAFTDAVPPKLERRQHLTTYINACWGSQLGSSVRGGTLLPLFKQ